MTTLTRNTETLRTEVAAHIEADALVRGQYWKGGKGCFIGCLTHSDNPAPAFERFGLPVAVLRIAESIFDNLPDEDGRAFFAALPDAVERDGKDLSRVHWAFLAAELRALPSVSQGVRAVIDPVIAGMELLASGGEWSRDAACDAAYAADAAAAAADYTVADAADYTANDAADYFAARATKAAADVAVRDIYDAALAARATATLAAAAAYDAADAANYAVAAAAYDAAYAARDTDYAASAAADYAARLRQRDTLLRLIKEAE